MKNKELINTLQGTTLQLRLYYVEPTKQPPPPKTNYKPYLKIQLHDENENLMAQATIRDPNFKGKKALVVDLDLLTKDLDFKKRKK